MSISGSAIGDALVTMLSAASVFGPGRVADDDWSIIEHSEKSAVVELVGFTAQMHTFGVPADFEVTWNHVIYIYVRDTGDAPAVKRNQIAIIDRVLGTILADDTLQGTVEKLTNVTGARDPTSIFTIPSGESWLRSDITVSSTQWS